MKRLAIYLSDEDHEVLRRRAFEERISMSELVRRALVLRGREGEKPEKRPAK